MRKPFPGKEVMESKHQTDQIGGDAEETAKTNSERRWLRKNSRTPERRR